MTLDRSLGVPRRIEELADDGTLGRLWGRDPGLWPGDPAGIRNRLGWLGLPREAPRLAGALAARLEGSLPPFDRVLLAGMGGSSMTPLVGGSILPAPPGAPELTILDTTDPAEVAEALAPGLSRTVLVVASKSGTTTEPLVLRDIVHAAFAAEGIDPASRTVVISDPGTPLARSEAAVILETPADVGGRFSALTAFGLAPLLLAGRDAAAVAASAAAAEEECRRQGPDNPALALGALLGEAALAGTGTLLIEDRPPLAGAGLWVEQLVAESLGKQGKGLIPVTRPSLRAPLPAIGGFAFVSQGAGSTGRGEGRSLPGIGLTVEVPSGLGRIFLVWEVAVALAGAVLGVNPFDEPDVASAKRFTGEALAGLGGGRPVSEIAPPADEPGSVRKALGAMDRRGYVALLLYLPDRPAYRAVAEGFRDRLEAALARPVLIQFGPRYLHSTGQAFKGGPEGGVFLVVTAPDEPAMPIPGRPFTLGDLQIAQAAGDHRALCERGRSAFWLPLADRSPEALDRLVGGLG